MRIINYAIIGSGISSFISSLKIKNSFVLSKFSLNRKCINRSFNFYEFNNVGGNTNVWGAYINLKLWKHYLNKNKKFLIFYQKNKYFTTSKISNLKLFKNIGYLKCKKTSSILRLNKDHFKKFINFELKKIQIKKKYIYLSSPTKLIKAKKVNLCIGNLGLIKVLKNSNLIKENDVVSYEDSLVRYFYNLNLNVKKYYYIPMSIKQIYEKLFYKSFFYKPNENDNNLIVQAFSRKKNIIRHTVKEIINNNSTFFRGLSTNHIANLRINNVPIKQFLYLRSRRILVNCSGTCKKYIPGSISQDLIYNSFLGS